jgi:septum site-determining protein MinD
MRSLTFTVSKGGVGKSILTANVGAALASKGQNVVLVEADQNEPLRRILNLDANPKAVKLENVVKSDLPIEKAIASTQFKNLSLVRSGLSLESYFSINPIRFAEKISGIKSDFVIVDVPQPIGEAAFLSFGVCQYFVSIITEDEFNITVGATIDSIRFGKYFLKCVPIGFVLNRIKNPNKFDEKFVKDLETLLGIPCIARICDDPAVTKSYDGPSVSKAYLAYSNGENSDFRRNVDQVADFLLTKLPKPLKENASSFIGSVIRPAKT